VLHEKVNAVYYSKTILALASLFGLNISLHSQATTLDSLKLELKNTSVLEERINIYEKVVRLTRRFSLDTSIYYAQLAVDELGNFENDTLQCQCHVRLGSILMFMSQFQKAGERFDYAFPFCKRPKELATFHNDKGVFYGIQSDYVRSNSEFKKAVEYKRQINGRGISSTLNNIANNYSALGEYKEALDYINQAIEASAEGPPQNLAYNFNTLSKIYHNLNELDKAMEAVDKAIPIFQDMGMKNYLQSSLGMKGLILLDLGKHQAAINVMNESIAIAKELGDESNIMTQNSALALVHSDMGNYTLAKSILQ